MSQSVGYSKRIRERVMELLESVYHGEDELSSHIRLISVHSPKSADDDIRITIRPRTDLIWSKEDTIRRLANQSIGDWVLKGEAYLRYASLEDLGAYSHMYVLLSSLDVEDTGMQVIREHASNGIEAYYFGDEDEDDGEDNKAQLMFIEKEMKSTRKRIGEMDREFNVLASRLKREKSRLQILEKSLEAGKKSGKNMLICEGCELVVANGYNKNDPYCPVCFRSLHGVFD